MKHFYLIFCFYFLCTQVTYAQYMGFRAEANSEIIRPSSETKLNQPFALALGIAGHYPLSPTFELVSDLQFATYKWSSDSRTYDTSLEKWDFNEVKSFKIKSIESSYGLRKGFGDEQHFKVGVGGFYNLFFGRLSDLQRTDYLGKDNDLYKNYDAANLYTRPNFGFYTEGIYNMNDALQFSIRFRKGLSNLYKTQVNSDISWKQSSIGVAVMYYFGAKERGQIVSKNKSNSKAKTKF